MDWESIEQVNSYFGLDVDNDNPNAVRRAIIKKMRKIHPDNNENQFKSENERLLWNELNSAKEFLNNFDKESATLISMSQLPAIIQSIQKANLPSIENRVSDFRQEVRADSHSRYLPFRIGSSVFAGIFGSLWAFSRALKDHPVLGDFISSKQANLAFILLMLLSGFCFLLTWVIEKKQEEHLDRLLTEEGIGTTIINLLRGPREIWIERQGNRRRFTLRDITWVLSKRGSIDEFSSHKLRPGIAEKVAKLQIASLKERGALIELPNKGFERIYELSTEATNELIGNNSGQRPISDNTGVSET